MKTITRLPQSKNIVNFIRKSDGSAYETFELVNELVQRIPESTYVTQQIYMAILNTINPDLEDLC